MSVLISQCKYRLDFLSSIFLYLVVAFLLGIPVPGETKERPHVIFIVADDLNCAIGPYGDPIAKTPNLNRLAARGLVFERAYCQQAVCNPSRSSFLTGLRPSTVGVDDLRKYFRNTAPNGKELITLPQHFKNHGWFCQNIGKIFHNMGDTKDRQSWSIDEVLFEGTHAADTVFFNTPIATGENHRPNYKAPVTEAPDAPDSVYRDGQIANLAAATIFDWQEHSQPLFLAIGFWRPHLPFVAPKQYWDLYDPDKISPPESNRAPKNAPKIALHESKEIRGYGLVPKDREFSDKEITHYRHGYYASLSFLDAQLGKILDALEETGLIQKSIIVFTSDHGFHVGEKGLWGKTSNFELDARVPLLISDSTRPETHGKRTNHLSELVDLYPTLAALAGISHPSLSKLEGSDLSPLLSNPEAVIDEAAFTQHEQPFYGPRDQRTHIGYSIRTDRWRYTYWKPIKKTDNNYRSHRELYDHSIDPNESTNVALDYPEVVRLLHKLLDQ